MTNDGFVSSDSMLNVCLGILKDKVEIRLGFKGRFRKKTGSTETKLNLRGLGKLGKAKESLGNCKK